MGYFAVLRESGDSEQSIRERLDADPWTPMKLLTIASIEPWNILLDEVA